MLFYVCMDVCLLVDMFVDVVNEIKLCEKVYLQDLQCSGKWCYIWCLVGEYVNVSVFDVQSNVELYDILMVLLLFLYMEILVILMCCYLLLVYSKDD